MNFDEINSLIKEFCQETHGRTDYDKDQYFVAGTVKGEFAPLKFLTKKNEEFANDPSKLLKMGFIYTSPDVSERIGFRDWFETQFGRKFSPQVIKSSHILQQPNQKSIFNALEEIFKCFELLRDEAIILNGKNMPIQLGEWFAKGIFGLKQIKSTSQRGFDFELNEKKVEVKVHWSDSTSPKGVKIKKSLTNLSDYVIIVYLTTNFMIRNICFLDSEFVMRKFSSKGHTIFLKENEVADYFFSKSNKHYDKVINKTALMKFATPTFAMKIDDLIS